MMALSACSGETSPDPSQSKRTSDSSVTPSPPSPSPTPVLSTITLNQEELTLDLEKRPLEVTSSAPITSVTMKGEGSEDIKWTKKDGKWLASGQLLAATTYTVTVVDSTQEKVFSLTSITPKEIIAPTLFPYEGTMGVGMPITVNFRKPVKDRAWAERHLIVKTTPETPGSWGWIQKDIAVWKPDAFWKPGTKVSVKVDMGGVETAEGQFGKRDVTGDFVIGREVKITVSNESKSLQFSQDGKVLKEMPVSLGKASTQTSTGTSIIYEKQNPVRMVGEGYDQIVDYAQRITTSGQYLHSAPWSVASQGNTNVSHGCINIGPSNAKWLYENTLLGDPVVVTGTTRPLETWNGMGAVWNYSQDEWKTLTAVQ